MRLIVVLLAAGSALAIVSGCSLDRTRRSDDDDAGEGGENGGGRSGSAAGGAAGARAGNAGAANGAGTGGGAGSSGADSSGGTGGTGNSVGGTAGEDGGGQGAEVGSAGSSAAGVGGSGATAGIAGTTGEGGTAGTAAGAGGTAGTSSSVECDVTFGVAMDGFVRAPMAGGNCWHGYAFGGGDTGSTLVFPGTGSRSDFGECMGTLRLQGTVGPATENNSYAGNVFLGVNLNQAPSDSTIGTVTPTGSSLVVTFSSSGPPMRVQLQAPGGSSDATKRWCAPLTASGTAIAYSSFTTECWDGGNQVAYTKQPLEAILITTPGGETEASFDVTLTGLAEM
jgi:hypothetical protein